MPRKHPFPMGPMGCGLGGTNFIFQHKEVLNTCKEFIGFVKCLGKPYIWERFVGIGGDLNERIKVANINRGEKAIIIWFFILKLTIGLNFFFFLDGAFILVFKPNFLD
jgi:hypothetical protein